MASCKITSCLIGDTSSNACFSFVMLVFWGVTAGTFPQKMGGSFASDPVPIPIFRVVLGLGDPVGSDPFLTERKRRFRGGGVRVCLYVSKRVFLCDPHRDGSVSFASDRNHLWCLSWGWGRGSFLTGEQTKKTFCPRTGQCVGVLKNCPNLPYLFIWYTCILDM